MSDSNQDKRGASPGWYGLSFVAVMAACAALVFLLQRLGFAVSALFTAVLVATLLHTLMSMGAVEEFPVGIVDSTDDKAMRRKLELFAGAFGGLVDIVLLLLIMFVLQWLDAGPVMTIILVVMGCVLPPFLGIVAGYHLAKRAVRRR